MTKKIFIIGLVLTAVHSMSGCMPGSEQWNIHIAAHCYIKGGRLQEGEKLFFVNGIQRKCLREWHGQTCKYVAVKYTFRKANGNLDQRIIIHPLMTEHCDSIIDCSYDGKAEWVKSDDLLNKEPLIAMMKGSESGGYLSRLTISCIDCRLATLGTRCHSLSPQNQFCGDPHDRESR